jgi:hypothetical protein
MKRTYTNGELFNALKIISETCENYKSAFNGQCQRCPLRNKYNDCALAEDIEPCEWDRNDLDDWTAFNL